MCGIAGILGRVEPGDSQIVNAMNKIQSHRGPDNSLVRSYSKATLGHTRLSIIDLSDRANQPMETSDGHFSIVFNGEIYNYKELRHELSNHHNFITDSDTEVLLAAYVYWGEKCLSRLNGMFAFCVLDNESGQAFIARDRFGQKPFCFTEKNGRLYFSSEIKALLAAGIQARPDNVSWARYLYAASYDDCERTFFQDVSQLQPGEYAVWKPGKGLVRGFYYRLSDHVLQNKVSYQDAQEKVRSLLLDSVRLHMRSDVPVGVSLSGGLDSSALLACIDHAGELHNGVHCVSVDFGNDLSEEKWISAAASHHGLPSRILNYSPTEFYESIKPMMWHLEGPLGGLMNCALAKVMKEAKSNGTVVIQDGTGLDEAFAGYRNHHNLYLGLLLRDGDPAVDRSIREYAVNWSVSEVQAREAGISQLRRNNTAIDGTIPVRRELLDKDYIVNNSSEIQIQASTGNDLTDALIDYLQVSKVPRNTRMKDRMSMAFNLELRLPFLDHHLVEYALSCPSEYLFIDGRSKAIVRDSMQGIMDDEVRLAAKRSIQAPQGAWLRQEPMKSYVNDLIHSDSFASRGMFDVSKCKSDFVNFCKGAYDNSFFVWQWINVEEWFRVFIDSDSVNNNYVL